MTPREAREIILCKLDCPIKEKADALFVAVDALEKQIPRAVIYEGDGYADGEMVYDVAHCPTCDACFEDGHNWEVNFCPNCGQRLDWSDDDGKEVH